MGLLKKIKFKPGRLFLIFIIGYMSFSFGKMYWQIEVMDKKIEEYLQIKQQLLEQRQILEEQIEKLHSRTYIERQARERLGLVKPGEKVILPAEPGEVVPLEKPRGNEILH